jgi:hypothetical protein
VLTDLVYRQEEWVGTFLAHVDAELTNAKGSSVHLDPARDALVVTGCGDGTETLRLARACYRDVLLFHPWLHRDVDARVDAAVKAAGARCAERGFAFGEELRNGGRRRLMDQPARLLHADVVEGLRRLDLSGLPALGVSGIVEVRSSDGTHVVSSLRSQRVAVNPACLGPSVDGGLAWTSSGIDPLAGLRNELKMELPWELDDRNLQYVGTLLPPSAPTYVGREPARRSGVNLVFRTSIEREPEKVFVAAPEHFETSELVLIETSGREAAGSVPPVIARRKGRVVGLAEVPPLSEVLAAVLARSALVDVTTSPAAGPPSTTSSRPLRSSREARAMTITASPAREFTLEDAWAEDLIERHTRLNRMLHPDRLSDLAETDKPPSLDTLGPLFDAVREFEFVRTGRLIRAADDARLFEALVYRIGRYLFANSEQRALVAHDLMAGRDRSVPLEPEEDPNPVGTAYTRRMRDAIDEDEKEDPAEVWRVQVAEALNKLNQDEAQQEYAEVSRRGRLLCFCAALWSLESKRSTQASTVALNDKYRKSLSGDVIALFFRARALLVSPVISAAQAQLGLQFVTTALASYERNPGMHHTKANFLLRQSALTEIEAVSLACLDQALESVETALRWDAEFAKFYMTRARIKFRMKDRVGALIDVRAAIELARYNEGSTVVQREVAEWEALLDRWQSEPVTGYGA